MKNLESLFQFWLPSPLQSYRDEHSDAAGIRVFVKRDDLIHHHISGNKYRKLKQHFRDFLAGDYEEIVAFGGAFSNLLYTLSFISARTGIPTTFYIRGDGYDPDNPSMRTMMENGVRLRFLDRQSYREKHKPHIRSQLLREHSKAYVVPEGGSDNRAVPGSGEIITELLEQLSEAPDFLVMDLGTGGTFAGVMENLPEATTLIGIPVLKGINWNQTLGEVLQRDMSGGLDPRVILNQDYHFGGFAKFNQELVDFINQFNLESGIPLEPIYTGKMVYGINDLIKSGYFPKGSTLVWVHSGGLQGIAGFNYLHGHLIRP